jgi:uncharacterized protein YrrD
MKLSELRGRKVVSRSSAEQLGEVTDLTVDLATSHVRALSLGKGRKAREVAWSDLHSVGPDAVIVEEDDRVVDAPPAAASPVGRLTLSDSGNALGDLSDVTFDEESGKISSVTTVQGEVEADRLLAVGPYAVIIATREEAEVPG